MKKLFFIGLLLFFFVGCGTDIKEFSKKRRINLPDMELEDFTVEQSYKGTLDWRLRARYAEVFEKSDIMNIDDIEIQFFKNKELRRDQDVKVRAKYGVMNITTKDLKLKGNVYLVTDNGLEMWTEELNWDNKKKKIETKKDVKIKRDGSIILARGMESSPDLEDIVLKKVKGRIKTAER